jgi:hypothetical protein
MSGYTSLPSRPGTLPVWPAATPLDPSGHVIYLKQSGEGYEAYEIPASRAFGAKSGSVTDGVQQTETLTITVGTGGADANGTVAVVVTGALLASPVTLSVSVAASDNATAVATKIKNAINGNAVIAAAYLASNTSGAITLTALAAAANDTSLVFTVASGNDITGGTSSNGTSGVYGTKADYLGQMAISGTTVKVATNLTTNTWTPVN